MKNKQKRKVLIINKNTGTTMRFSPTAVPVYLY